ncbi:MAG: hemolysin-type calcium-binding repeat family protein [Polaromonas sp.]|nr:hemolysin-type calcium-binding repeat family protein [Polaromonas sp.]
MASYTKHDLEFILAQIKLAEADVAGGTAINVVNLIASPQLSLGLRTINGTQNNLLSPGQNDFGAADKVFDRLLRPVFNNAEGAAFDPDGPGPMQAGSPTSYHSSGSVFDSSPRTISNLIVDQTENNPAALAAALKRAELGGGVLEVLPGRDGILVDNPNTAVNEAADNVDHYFIPNRATDEGLSAQYNSWFTLFGQIFDHGLDSASKGGNGTVFMPLKPDDPLYSTAPGAANFMVLTRTTQVAGPGPDGILVNNPATGVNEAADNTQDAINSTSPFVDQNQTYGSHPSKQVFLRAYDLVAGRPQATGELIENRNLGADGRYGTGDDTPLGGMATWAVVKAQARDILGINLTDADVTNLPLLATDDYGNFLRGPNGFPRVVFGTNDLREGTPTAPLNLTGATRTGHAFLDDIAHSAAPRTSSGAMKIADGNNTVGGPLAATEYDNELLDAHYIAGDGRANENIGLTAVHAIFHSEHNRMVEHTKDVVLASNDLAFLNEWLRVDITALPTTSAAIAALSWDGERLFQAAKFGTEMQYQHLVFEEFARKIQVQVDVFAGYDTTINPGIVAEFAHVVYRFGHSMLNETVDRFDADFTLVNNDTKQIGLIEAFLNPLEYVASGADSAAAAASIVRGMTRQAANELDEFVTEALRSNLVGLPLDLAALNIARGRETGVPSLNAARREFYAGTSDAQLKPYVSWVDFSENTKHAESVINFVAAYGTHEALRAADVDTLAEKRAVATALIMGGNAAINAGTPQERTFTATENDRLDFLNSAGAYANGANGVTTTGVDAIDFWIGGLAEKQMPFGGLLGSTFNFVFETQMEKLQDGDRLYYLARAAGLNFLTELEANSFASLISLNTGANHLPGDVFSTPDFILEVDKNKQFNEGLGATGNADPTGGTVLVPSVIRNNPATPGTDANYLKFTGGEHVVLGGTEGNDILIASIGDDTIWGDGGNDRIEGGAGNDILNGGDGDDIMTDTGGDDNLKGNEGNDVINGGNGFDLIIAGGGSDFVVAGEDPKEVFANQGNDFVLGSSTSDTIFGDQGDDWIDGGGQADLLQGDMGDPFQQSTIFGNDVLIGGGGNDDFDAESGDDIMAMDSGTQRANGMLGFDWVTHKGELVGATADLNFTGLLPATLENFKDRFDLVEGVSGWRNDDTLRGDSLVSADLIAPGVPGDLRTNNALNNTAQISLINGLQGFLNGMLGGNQTSFSGGNVLMGGEGSDLIEGRGGDDLIDGDAWLNVRIAVTGNSSITNAESMAAIAPRLFSGEINPGQLSIVREILTTPASLINLDTAVYSGNFAEYTMTINSNGTRTINHTNPVGLSDGVDTIRNIERLVFADQTLVIGGANIVGTGTVTINDITPTENAPLTVAGTFSDANGVNASTIAYTWEAEVGPDTWIPVGTGTQFIPGDFESGHALRVKATFDDLMGVTETVYSPATAPVINVNDVPTGTATANLPAGAEDVVYNVTAVSLLEGFTDLDVGDELSVANLTSSNGSVSAGPAGTFNITPALNFSGNVTLSYNVVDGKGGSRPASQTFNLAAVNDAPTGTATGTITGSPVGNTFTVLRSVLLAGFSDVDGDALSIIDLVPSSGVVSPSPSGDFIITQAPGFVGLVTLNYKVVDGPGAFVAGSRSYTHSGASNPTTGELHISSYASNLNNANLTATNTLADADLPGLVRTYQWQRLDAGNWVNVAGLAGTAATLTAQSNATLRVTSSYTDPSGLQSFISPETAVIGTSLDNILTGTAGIDFVLGLAGNDTLSGSAGNDTVDGGNGNDLLRASLNDGNDVYRGGLDIDTYDLSLTTAGAIVNLTLGTSTSTDTGTDTLADIENVRGSSGVDVITDRAGIANTLQGNGQNDRLVMVVDGVRDILDGGTGLDIADYTAFTTALTVNLGTSAVVGGSGPTVETSDSMISIESFTGGGGNDNIVGTVNSNTLIGGLGNDILNGLAGNDVVNGGDGNDTIVSTSDGIRDFLNGDLGSGDTADYSAFITALSATLSNGSLVGGSGSAVVDSTDMLFNFENFIGGSGGDTITGSALANTLSGGLGNDTLNGLGGNDVLIGGDGLDRLVGGTGQDRLTGGTGADIFDINTTGESPVGTTLRDVVTDFARGIDKIDFSTLDANTGVAGDQAFTFNFTAGAAFSGAGQLRYRYEGTGVNEVTLIEGNVNSTLTADFQVALTGRQTFLAQDIVL